MVWCKSIVWILSILFFFFINLLIVASLYLLQVSKKKWFRFVLLHTKGPGKIYIFFFQWKSTIWESVFKFTNLIRLIQWYWILGDLGPSYPQNNWASFYLDLLIGNGFKSDDLNFNKIYLHYLWYYLLNWFAKHRLIANRMHLFDNWCHSFFCKTSNSPFLVFFTHPSSSFWGLLQFFELHCTCYRTTKNV